MWYHFPTVAIPVYVLKLALQGLYTGKTTTEGLPLMFYKSKGKYTCTSDDYRVGRHYQWECEAHEAGARYEAKYGRTWVYKERNAWLCAYMLSYPPEHQMAVRECSVCAPIIAQAIASGDNPFRVPDELKLRLAQLGVRIRNPSQSPELRLSKY
jgi:hypothetical protein